MPQGAQGRGRKLPPALRAINAPRSSCGNPAPINRILGEKMRHAIAMIPIGLSLLCLSGVAQAGDPMTIGQFEFANSCAQCHGPGGKGDGPLAKMLKEGAPDLTRLQRDNGGVFPVAKVYDLIRGETLEGGHGTPEMPAWGMRYRRGTPDMLGPYYTPGDAQDFVQGRILALVEHIASLQTP